MPPVRRSSHCSYHRRTRHSATCTQRAPPRGPEATRSSIVGPHEPPSHSLHSHSASPDRWFPVMMRSWRTTSSSMPATAVGWNGSAGMSSTDHTRAPKVLGARRNGGMTRICGWSGPGAEAASEGWTVDIGDLRFELRPTAAGQVGLFPEHAVLLPWRRERVAMTGAAPAVLNLFAYTGLISLGLAKAGASVVHVDAAKPSVDWARRNATLDAL